ncbi:cell division protein anillin-domain-containing protein [Lasiosphaeria miniovina]|uniref:Cell division protein anillin-domain-containing protein n=1 Tax=Lasiosphaeria miniovina TaxID=1954250 RepID=A0AA40E364_9PEZI|nr:cell division protein anillin-domain-containing protein [Lasiosphaeria miniovina]KAK0722421.1 cell division protein anillin-domain-containing protein [Lasiosphaeria miniovina]
MASEDPVHPLRLTKSNTMSSPTKPASAIPRPLSEISPMEHRRNSPSWNQPTKKMSMNPDSSPFQPSPMDGTTSPRLFWQNRGFSSENTLYGSTRSGSPSPTRRSSIERLQKASRVKNSNILALEHKQEYDPTRVPQVERPLAKVQGNAFGGTGIGGLRLEQRGFGHHRSESKTNIPIYSPAATSLPPPMSSPVRPATPSKDQESPIKSSLSTTRFKSSFDPETGSWSADTSGDEHDLPEGRFIHRHAKSVTFDAAPPQVNEYELATPDLSSIGSNSREGSYESNEEDEDDDEHYVMHEGDSHNEDSFDASLEDTDKTPVVGPDDWRQDGASDRFEKSPLPEDAPATARPQHNRTDSTNSNGEHRPLPPLPGQLARSHSTSSNGLSATAERMLGAHRSLPSPPPAATTKSEMQNIGNTRMPLEERLRLMMLSDDGKTAAEQQRERRMRRAGARDRTESQTPERDTRSPSAQPADEEDDTIGDISGLEEYQLPPRISRESIMRRVNGNKLFERESDYNFSSPAPSSSPERPFHYDPDVPIPSTEDSMLDDVDEEDEEGSVIINRDHDKDYDVDSITDMYRNSETPDDELYERNNHGVNASEKERLEDDSESQYSADELPSTMSQDAAEDDQASTPRAGSPANDVPEPLVGPDVSETLQLPEENKENDFSKSFESYMLPKPTEEPTQTGEPEKHKMADAQTYMQRPSTPERPLAGSLSKPEYDGSGWGEPEDEYDEPSTPESVIHHPVSDSEEEEARASPAIPEQLATIKSASGSKLKTRPSATPSDIMAMREARRHVSREVPVPPIPERHRSRLSRDMEVDFSESTGDDFLDRHPSFKKRSLTLDLDLGLSLDKDFDRVIEAQKRGYLMRQNTKLVAASDKESDEFRSCRSAGNSPVKQTRPQSWTVEPWNGQPRARSVRKRHAATGPVPPLPGQESNAVAMNTLNEEEIAAEMATVDSGERGRLFVKVMGVKDLDLPIPKNERTWFSLTLDNGVHCVTTAWMELARNAPIGQEFELVVPNDLEFQLTLNVKLEKPAPKKVAPAPIKISKPKTSTFSRVFASPRKRKEMELRHREEEERQAQQQREAQARQMNTQPTAWDLLSPLAAGDGSFARSYVCLKEHETKCFGRPYLVEVAAFNEWATEEAGFASSVKSKRGNTAVVRRAPYKIGKLELQLLFVPRPKGSTDDDMPKSMNSCIREMKVAEERLSRNWEGPLSQQGGDCPYWRRRYFKLVGTKLTAYHEATRQPRATINLANAKRLIDDRRALLEKETLGKGGKRRRSGFAEEEEGYMFVEEGFRIRFNNGEVIDFYADSTQDKDGWMKVLSEIIGRDSLGSGSGLDDDAATSRAKGKWCELVLKREETLRRRVEGRRVHSRTKSMYL